MAIKMTTIVVEGRSHFPIDMLRYDSCAPATSCDVVLIEQSLREHGQYSIHLDRWSDGGRVAEHARWKSFGWRVTSDTGRVR